MSFAPPPSAEGVVLALLGLAGLAVFVLGWAAVWKRVRLPYTGAEFLLTRSELDFYRALAEAARSDFHVTFKVRLGDVVRCSDRLWAQGFGQRIATQHVDFVLVDPQYTRVRLCIELDDASHERRHRRRRDRWINRVFEVAGTPLLRVKASGQYDPERLRRRIWATIREHEEHGAR